MVWSSTQFSWHSRCLGKKASDWLWNGSRLKTSSHMSRFNSHVDFMPAEDFYINTKVSLTTIPFVVLPHLAEPPLDKSMGLDPTK